ncbi:MAG: hypothetical protein QM811_07505 [Pirellulales bacterium]
MQLREKVLLIAFACVGGSWFVVKPFVASTFVEPLEDRAKRIDSLTGELSDKEAEDLVQMKAAGRLNGYNRRSLPPIRSTRIGFIWRGLPTSAKCAACRISRSRSASGRRSRRRSTPSH